MLAFGTSSSAASMPVAMKCGEDYGCAGSIVRFVIPMGTNINRDGAALYEAVSVMFICQVPHSSSGFIREREGECIAHAYGS